MDIFFLRFKKKKPRLQSGDVHLDVDASKRKTGTIGKQASTSQYDRTHKLTSIKDFCKVTDAQLLENLNAHYNEKHTKYQKIAVIQRVPEVLQRNNDFKKCYQPMELSVGPLHAADPCLFKAELKFKLAARYLRENENTTADLFEDIKNNLKELKMCFDPEEIKSYDDEILARHLFLDGCAVLQFINSCYMKSLNEFSINNGQAELIRQDLLLFENQIPFKVLQLLMGIKSQKSQTVRKENGCMKDHLARFLLNNTLMELGDHRTLKNLKDLIDCDSERKPVLHLLDLLRSLLVMDSPGHKRSFSWLPFCITVCFSWCFVRIVSLAFRVSYAFGSFVVYIVSCFVDIQYEQQSFRNVQELAAAGITLKPIDSCNLKDIAFRKRWFFRGRVELPPLIVDSSTASKMLNLVAYEMCSPDYEENCYVTSYINLIDLLIDDANDVKLLRSADILRNRLSTDTEVATLINKIGSTCLSPPTDTYLPVKSDIENHYKRRVVVWMAQAYHAHFSSPWTILALLAAVTVLLLTAIQTWYAIYPKK